MEFRKGEKQYGLVSYTTLNKNMEMNLKPKGKAIPLQVWTGPESSKRLRLPDFKTIGT
jgi:hypothetical protein